MKYPKPAERRKRARTAAGCFVRDRLTPAEVRERGRVLWHAGYESCMRDVAEARRVAPICRRCHGKFGPAFGPKAATCTCGD